jgi:hypothetical protein
MVEATLPGLGLLDGDGPEENHENRPPKKVRGGGGE